MPQAVATSIKTMHLELYKSQIWNYNQNSAHYQYHQYQ